MTRKLGMVIVTFLLGRWRLSNRWSLSQSIRTAKCGKVSRVFLPRCGKTPWRYTRATCRRSSPETLRTPLPPPCFDGTRHFANFGYQQVVPQGVIHCDRSHPRGVVISDLAVHVEELQLGLASKAY